MQAVVEKFHSEPLADIYCGDAVDVLRSLPSESTQMCMCSPPYWGLRNYAGGADLIWGGKEDCQHEWLEETFVHEIRTGLGLEELGKKYRGGGHKLKELGKQTVTRGTCIKCSGWRGQLGLEPTPELYVDHLMMIFREVKRVLKKEGSFYLNIGDTYAGSGMGAYSGGVAYNPKKLAKVGHSNGFPAPRGNIGIPPKCMTCIPERVLFAMLADGWRLRNKIAWVKPNNMPKSVKDRFTDRWEFLYFFVKARRYYFNLDAVRVPHKTSSLARYQGEDDLFSHGPGPQSFNLRVRDVKRGKKGTSAQGGELRASGEEIQAYEYPEKHHGSRMNNQEALHRDRVYDSKYDKTAYGQPKQGFQRDHTIEEARERSREDGERLFPDDPEKQQEYINYIHDHQSHPKGKNPGDVWTITTKPSSISVCPKCDTVFKRLLKVCPQCGAEGIVGHFAPYPETLCTDPIKASTRKGDTVLDIFAGSGTTGVAAKRLGRKAILIDCVRPYCVMAKYNLQKVEFQPNLVL